ncbi:MAG: transporter substrate binding protein (Dipeptide) [Chloroflexi bacterium]|nr:transporter substrate binding protein (Dipeptide) [Chloroflexota bacterium]
MTRTKTRSPILALLATMAIIAAACGGAATPAPSAEPTPAPTVGPTAVPFAGLQYPEDGNSACGTEGYEGQMGLIKAIDATTVEFTLCAPDAAFLSKIAFASLGIQDGDYLASTGGGGDTLIRNPVGTGAYKLKAWTSGSEIALEAYADYWGEQPGTPNVVFRWSGEAAQRLVELQSGNVDGIDNPGTDDFATIAADPSLALYPRVALSTMYLGMNNTKAPWDNEKVRKAIALGIDRQRIVDNFYPAGSSVADYFTPCEIPGGCGGDPWYDFDPAAAKALLTEAGFPDGFATKLHLRDVVRGYLPAPVVVAQDIQAQLKANLNITAEIDVQDASTYLGAASRGELPGLFILGWGADYPDVTNFLDVFFGVGSGIRFGDKWEDIMGPLTEGGATSDPAARAALYTTANNAIREHIPMVPMAHGGSGTAYRADVTGAHSSPLGNEQFSAMKAGDRDTLVWMQNGEPGGLYCPDETDGESLRVCTQINESLYAYEVGGTAPIPSLATGCEANADSTVWTCTLREGVTFHNGAVMDANDVVTTYAVMWDAAHPLHVGRADQGLFEYWTYLFAAFLNPPAA